MQVRAGTRGEYLEPPQVTVTLAWSRDTYPRFVYPGECYERAFAYVLDHDIAGMLLVHGRNTRLNDEHAWVELPGGIVFDGVAQRFFAKDVYEAVMQVKPVAVYAPDDATHLLLTTTSYGPWCADCTDDARHPVRTGVLAHAS